MAQVGARAAVNISGVEVDEVSRGDLLAQPGYFETTYMIDARLHMLPDAPAHVDKSHARSFAYGTARGFGPRGVARR